MRPLYSAQSPFQKVELFEGDTGDVRLYLNGQPQFDGSRWRDQNHGCTQHAAMLCPARGAARVLGGGTGLSTRMLLDAGFESVRVFEIDEAVVRLATEHPALRALNGDAFRDPRVQCFIIDALDDGPHLSRSVDLVVNDASLGNSSVAGLDAMGNALAREVGRCSVYAMAMDAEEVAAIGARTPAELHGLVVLALSLCAPEKRVYTWNRSFEVLGHEDYFVVADPAPVSVEAAFLAQGGLGIRRLA